MQMLDTTHQPYYLGLPGNLHLIFIVALPVISGVTPQRPHNVDQIGLGSQPLGLGHDIPVPVFRQPRWPAGSCGSNSVIIWLCDRLNPSGAW